MQTHLADWIRDTPDGAEAESILRKCVHCGFCNATCPTYQLLGEERDGPRGRIYLIKQMLEGAEVTATTQFHLDRCLTCRNCETTCPSGVQYGRLLDIGRHWADRKVQRPLRKRVLREILRAGLTSPMFGAAMKLGRAVRPLLPAALKARVPASRNASAYPAARHARRMILLEGCVQPALSPNINTATARVLNALGIELLRPPGAGCCGAIRHHLDDRSGGLAAARRNIDAWWPLVEDGAQAIVMNASGCGLQVREYGHMLRNDPAYAGKARRISELTRDVAQIVPGFTAELQRMLGTATASKVVFHSPCTLQHGQNIRGSVEALLESFGVAVLPAGESHFCCGSAGTYSILQPGLATQLRDRRLGHLQAAGPDAILSANIGCIMHLQSGTSTPVMHWIEWVDQRLRSR